MTLTKDEVRIIGREAQEALEAVASKHGMTVKVGGGTYDPTTGTFRPKVEFSAEDSAEIAFRRDAHFYGLEPDHFGREFKSGGKTFRIVGLNPRAPKFAVRAVEVSTGREFKVTLESVQRALGIANLAVATLVDVPR